MEEICEDIVDKCVPQYRALSASFKVTIQSIVDDRSEHVRSSIIENWVKVESAPFTLQPEFFKQYNERKIERFIQAYDKMAPCQTLGEKMHYGEEGADVGRDRMVEWYKRTHSVGDHSNALHEAEDMQMLLESYWKTAVDRSIDSLCMKIDEHLIQGLASDALRHLIALSHDDAKSAVFFAQDPRIREKRNQLEARLQRLTRAQVLINSSA